MRYVIASPGFQDDVGGIIVLHYLCHLLNELGEEALLYPYDRRPLRQCRTPSDYLDLVKYYARRVKRREWRYNTKPGWNTPLAPPQPPSDAVVIYPEIVKGNPLGARHVVRWFLHKPGFLTGVADYGDDELCFYYQRAFDDARNNRQGENLLRIAWHRDDVYHKTNFGERNGTCYMLRKGRGRPLVHDARESMLVDGMSHGALAKVFNEKKYFISYDPYTMYSRFAAMCGCIPVVVPEPGVPKVEWRPETELRLGIAYGFDDVEWAIETQPALTRFIVQDKARQSQMVAQFVSKTKSSFPDGRSPNS